MFPSVILSVQNNVLPLGIVFYYIVKPALKGTSIEQITVYRGQPHFPH